MYLSFSEARKNVHKLSLKSGNEWFKYSKSNNKEQNIPADPKKVYLREWISMGDWLGTGRIADQNRVYMSFEKAREFVHNLKLFSRAGWSEYCKSGDKPDNIPYYPNQTYFNNGWISMGDWLGTYTIAPKFRKYRKFKYARKFVHSLKIYNTYEWSEYCKSGDKPSDIPAAPRNAYKGNWKSMGDWLGSESIATYKRSYKSFIEAKKYIQSLNFKSTTDWQHYVKSKLKPDDIPAKPNEVYREKGWSGMGDWLGTGNIANRLKKYRSFLKAKVYVHSLGLKNQQEWRTFIKSDSKPIDIPSAPESTYKNEGWKGMGDWIGTGRIADQNKIYRNYADAKKFVHQLKIVNQKGWKEYSLSGNKPNDIPSNPYQVYNSKGWVGLGDWLGTGINAPRNRIYLTFNEARDYVRKLKLKNTIEWNNKFKAGKMPLNIPRSVDRLYKDKGWKGWADFLGKETKKKK